MSTTPTERPIIFSGPMVRAILDGRKTQTRRVMKPQPFYDWDHSICPYGKSGDRLWVRETWASPEADKTKPGRVAYSADGVCGCWFGGGEGREFVYHGRILEASGYSQCFPVAGATTFGLAEYSDIRRGEYPNYRYNWRSPIHMPRWASRIILEVVKVRVERVQDISESDAIAEGIQVDECNHVVREDGVNYGGAVSEFAVLWDRINGPRGYGWEANPWVWVIEFKRVE